MDNLFQSFKIPYCLLHCTFKKKHVTGNTKSFPPVQGKIKKKNNQALNVNYNSSVITLSCLMNVITAVAEDTVHAIPYVWLIIVHLQPPALSVNTGNIVT